jgi:hypothetical protein
METEDIEKKAESMKIIRSLIIHKLEGLTHVSFHYKYLKVSPTATYQQITLRDYHCIFQRQWL